nr:hypothetical protein Iba_chr09fCG13470 [Ipomoea batatas]
MHEQKTYTSGFGFSSTHFRTASSVALIGAFMSIIGRGCRGRSGECSSTGRFPLSFAWISGGGSDELPAARGISSRTSASPPSTFTSIASRSCLCSPSPYSLATALTSSQPCLGFCSRSSGWGRTSACGIDGPASSGGAFLNSKALSMCPNPKPPYFISACSLIDSSLNVQDRKAGLLLGTVLITSRAKCLLNQGSPASVSNILVIIALGVMHAVLFSKIALHSRRISGTALAARLVISICPIGSPRVAATSAAVIWIDCPFWSCKHAPGQAAEFVLLLARVQSLFWVPLLWMSPLFSCFSFVAYMIFLI